MVSSRKSRTSHFSHQSRKPNPEKKTFSEDLFGSSDDDSSKPGSRAGSRSRIRSNSSSRARSTSSRSRSRSKSGSRSRSYSNSGSDSRSSSRSRSRSGSRSGSGKRSRSCSKSGSRPRSNSRSRSRSSSGSRSSSRSNSGSRSRSKSNSESRSRSRSSLRNSKSRRRSRSRGKSDSQSIPCSKSGSGTGSDNQRKRPRAVSDSDSSESDIGSKKKIKRKHKTTGSCKSSDAMSDSDSEEPVSKKIIKKSKKSKLSGNESGSGSENGNVHNGIQEKLGSDRYTNVHSDKSAKLGRPSEGSKKDKYVQKAVPQLSDSEDEALRQQMRHNPEQEDEHVNDFEAMLARKKTERGYKRKKEGVDVLNDNEEKISQFVRMMRNAAEEDRKLNIRKQPATKKMSMLQVTMQQISKVEMLEGFLEANLLSALTDWMAPMPDRKLPTQRLRECVLNWLLNLPTLSQEMLKQSGIGKAIMYLYRHPKEVKLNKERCGRLINKWSRPIFNNSDDFTTLSKEERLQRDMQMMAMGRNSRNKENEAPSNLNENGEPLKPGDKGWCHRARVPMPCGKDYVARPKWKSNVDMTTVKKQGMSKLDKNMRHFANQKRLQMSRRAVSMSIEGRAMPL